MQHFSLRRKVVVMASVMASLFLVALDQTIIATALGKIVEEFQAFDSLSWIVTSYLITTTITVPIAGKLSDLFGRRKILLIGVGIFVVASLLSGLSGSVTDLVAWRAVQGIGGGIITANAFTIVGDLFAARERGRWQGFIGAVFGLSSVVGPLLGGWLTDYQSILGMTTDWRWTFFINVPIGIAAFILISIFSPSMKHAKRPVVDYMGAALLSVILTLIILAVDNTETIFAGLLDTTGWTLAGLRTSMFVIAALLTATFIWVEHRAKEPILPLEFFKNRNFVLIITVAGLFGAAFMGSILYLTQFNQQVFGATPTESGLMLLPMVGGIMLTSIVSGQIISRIGKYKIFMQVGFVIATVAMFMLTTLTPDSTYTYEAWVMVMLGLGMGVAMPVLNLAIQNEFKQSDLGIATSSNQLFRSLGSTVGTAVFGSILIATVASNMGAIKDATYLQTISKSPEVSQIGNLEDVNTVLTLNMPDAKAKITDYAKAGIDQLPQERQESALESFNKDQEEFASKVETAFADGLSKIFLVSTALMLVATVCVFMLKERELKAVSADVTPGAE